MQPEESHLKYFENMFKLCLPEYKQPTIRRVLKTLFKISIVRNEYFKNTFLDMFSAYKYPKDNIVDLRHFFPLRENNYLKYKMFNNL